MLPFTKTEALEACEELGKAALAQMEEEFERRNLLPILGEARIVLSVMLQHIGTQAMKHLLLIIADGHDITALLPSISKLPPPPSPL